jgi:hypothetical protein
LRAPTLPPLLAPVRAVAAALGLLQRAAQFAGLVQRGWRHHRRLAAANRQRGLHQSLNRVRNAAADRTGQQQSGHQQQRGGGAVQPQRAVQLSAEFACRHADGDRPAILAAAAVSCPHRDAIDRGAFEAAFGRRLQRSPESLAGALPDKTPGLARAGDEHALAVEHGAGPLGREVLPRQQVGKALQA